MFSLRAEPVKPAAVFHDAHIHYDQDVWGKLPPARATARLAKQNIQRALVSATPTQGAEMLYRANPGLVIPMLRPYKSWRHRYFWFKDPELKAYLLEHLARAPYRGFGEFHVSGQDMDTAQIAEMIALARERDLVLHPHTDLVGMRILLTKARDVRVMWAHGGFDVPVATLQELLDAYPNLYIDLSLRDAMLDADSKLTPQWQTFLTAYPRRFLVGSDTFKPRRWANLPEILAETRGWLAQLPVEVADNIARDNLDRLFPH